MITKNRAKLLKLFYAHPDRAFYMQEIGRVLGKKPGVFQRTLNKMEEQGILRSEYKANARYFKANTKYPIYKELKSIIFKTSRALVIFILLIFTALHGFCEEANLLPLSLEDAIRIAHKNNKTIQIQEKEVIAARANILDAQSVFLPQLGVGASYTHNDQITPVSNLLSNAGKRDPHIFTGYKNDNKANASVNTNLFDGGANYANLNQAQTNLKIQSETLRARKLDIEFEAKRLYYGLLLAYETERITQDLVDQAKAHYEDVKARYEQGTSSRFDLLQSKVQVSKLIPELVKAKNAIYLIMADFNKLLSLRVQDPVRIQGKLVYSPIGINEEAFLKEAYLGKPEMILRSLGVNMSKWSIETARANGMPQIDTNFDYTWRSNDISNMINRRHSNWDFGIAVTMPIFDGFSTKAKVDAARAKYAQSKLEKADVADQIAVDVRQACLDLAESEAIIKSQEDSIVEAREAMKIAVIGYDNGVTTNLDVLDTQVSLSQVEKNLAEGTYDYLMAHASLDRNLGREYAVRPVNADTQVILHGGTDEKKD
ncbi:MAG: TolC family protein [Candidatus Omnitrophica bacterium]|nr:TolC family protein [Candidatus Omnitrophota bacterium]